MLTRLLLLFVMISLSGCNTNKPASYFLMQAPEIYDELEVNPFTDSDPIQIQDDPGILYATDRLASESPEKPPYYESGRGHLLRLGVADVWIVNENITWEETKKISLVKNRSRKYPMNVSSAQELGILPASVENRQELSGIDNDFDDTDEFDRLLIKQMEGKNIRDVFIYVHGYKVTFINPILVANELWHYLGYEGAFIAYAWPATRSRWAYNHDLETATYSSRNMRRLIEHLSTIDQVERINIIAYSAGTRVVSEALWQLALKNNDDQKALDSLKINNVILAGSDIDRDEAFGYASDGVLDLINRLTIYQSAKDKALSLSSLLFGRERLGQITRYERAENAFLMRYIDEGKLITIDVSKAADAFKKNGHSYFRDSPWVSSDVLITLRYELDPDERGLIFNEQNKLWEFPEDYIEQSRKRILEEID